LISIISPIQVVSLTTAVEEDGKVTIVVGFSQKLKDIKKDI
jgi:hypothetical protein